MTDRLPIIPDPPGYKPPPSPPKKPSIAITQQRTMAVFGYLINHGGQVYAHDPRDLARNVAVGVNSLSMLLRGLAAKGYIGRITSPSARRLWLRQPALDWLQEHKSEFFELNQSARNEVAMTTDDTGEYEAPDEDEASTDEALENHTVVIGSQTANEILRQLDSLAKHSGQISAQAAQIGKLVNRLAGENADLARECDRVRAGRSILFELIEGTASRARESIRQDLEPTYHNQTSEP